MSNTSISSLPKMILSIQSHVAYGHAGNSAAVFPLQRLGFEVLPVHTVQFSNHTGYGAFRGQVFTAEHIQELITGMKERDVLRSIEAVLSGYMGDGSIGNAILNAVSEVRALNPQAVYLCDPVMGDVGRGLFVKENIPDFMRSQAVPAASIITPNQFEFELITGQKLGSISDAISIARELMQHSAPYLQTVVITSMATPDVPEGKVGTLAVTAGQAWLVTTPFIDIKPLPNGMGDVFSSVFLGRTLQGHSVEKALEAATSTLFALVSHTVKGSRDLPLIALQEQIVKPQNMFSAVSAG